MGCFCVGVVMWLHPLVDELNDQYPAYWSNSRQGLGADLVITGLPTVTFHKRGNDRLTVRVGREIVLRDQSIDRVPDVVVSIVLKPYTDYLRRLETPPELPSWLIQPMIEWWKYVQAREINDAVWAYNQAMADVDKINKHIQKMKETV